MKGQLLSGLIAFGILTGSSIVKADVFIDRSQFFDMDDQFEEIESEPAERPGGYEIRQFGPGHWRISDGIVERNFTVHEHEGMVSEQIPRGASIEWEPFFVAPY